VNTLPPENSNVNGTIEEVLEFSNAMEARGIYSQSAARNYQVALRQLTEVLAEDEPRDAVWVLSNLKPIAERFAVKFGAKPTTVRTYLTRATTLLQGFLDYRRDPLSFKGNSKPLSSEPRAKPKAVERMDEATETTTSTASSARTWTQSFPTSAGPVSINLPLGANGRMGYTKDEWYRIAVAVMAQAADYEPTEPNGNGGTRSGAGTPPTFLPPSP
jgi:hypothetical protein